MDTRFLESLLAVAETGSIAAAARQQGLTAAAISQRIRVLETEFGERLLNRSAHAAAPTEACLRLLPAARRLVRDAERLRGRIDPDGFSGPFRLGAVSTALLDDASRVIGMFRQKAPNVVLSIRPGASDALYQDLLVGTLDGAITVAAPFDLPKSVASFDLAEQRIVHVTPPAAVATGRGPLPWIVYDRTSWGGRRIFEACRRDFFSGHILCELDAPETIALMVSEGIGQAILPQWRRLTEQYPEVTLRELKQSISRKMVFLRPRASATTHLSELVVSGLQSGVV
ncbi:LysR family transcriptional regulator [Roseibium sediminicola]|uniref:LysR family transcriptional regulator n=1 Tax=Roseibium sediminicola TaxID=2933272 RepID=A0ABT0GUZ4_9HYPH|nr:LysR family transcriptional regulator [Roseibium sp. CAU 1639]MCK7613253.1 LysR family transcriptional regulator [Roseibium sp. CAU 1639]